MQTNVKEFNIELESSVCGHSDTIDLEKIANDYFIPQVGCKDRLLSAVTRQTPTSLHEGDSPLIGYVVSRCDAVNLEPIIDLYVAYPENLVLLRLSDLPDENLLLHENIHVLECDLVDKTLRDILKWDPVDAQLCPDLDDRFIHWKFCLSVNFSDRLCEINKGGTERRYISWVANALYAVPNRLFERTLFGQ